MRVLQIKETKERISLTNKEKLAIGMLMLMLIFILIIYAYYWIS